MNKYIIDACALIEIDKNYMREIPEFAWIWDSVAKMIRNNQLIISTEIYEEIKDDELNRWLKFHSCKFIKLSKEIQNETMNILKLFPNLIKIRSRKASSSGDPFLIATANVENAVVVTNERFDTNRINVPYVCKKMGVKCINHKDFIKVINKMKNNG